jgi:hypothetical protein
MSRFVFSLCGLSVLAPLPIWSAEPLHQQIDRLIEARAGGQVAPAADDAEFLRRAYLDLNGIVPTADDVRGFLSDRDPEKRTKQLDYLLATPDYARRMREAFTVMLLERRTGTTVPAEEWNQYLESSFAENQPWDQFVRELFIADAADEKTRGTVKFFVVAGRADHDQMTRDVARLFLGMNIHCAKCHDHPNVDQFKQADYFGLSAYLMQSKAVKHTTLQKTFLVESVAKAKVEFESVFDPGNTRQTGPRLPGGTEVEIPTFETGEEFSELAKDGLPAVPKFQPRQLLATHLTDPSNRRFVENSVNRFWFLMMGRGLVHPLDMLHEQNPPSHPQLMKLLADEFVAHKFDVRWLLREIVLSKTYQRSSILPEGVEAKDAPAHSYRVANAKGLTAEQMAWSMMRVTGVLDQVVKTTKSPDSKFTFKDYINGRIPPPDNLSDTMLLFVSVFGNPPGEPEVEFQPSMGQALFLMNEQLVLSWLKPGDGTLVGRLEKESDPKKIADELYVNILSRFPNAEESADVVSFLEQNEDRRAVVIGQYAWAMLTSAEFKLNH